MATYILAGHFRIPAQHNVILLLAVGSLTWAWNRAGADEGERREDRWRRGREDHWAWAGHRGWRARAWHLQRQAWPCTHSIAESHGRSKISAVPISASHTELPLLICPEVTAGGALFKTSSPV